MIKKFFFRKKKIKLKEIKVIFTNENAGPIIIEAGINNKRLKKQ